MKLFSDRAMIGNPSRQSTSVEKDLVSLLQEGEIHFLGFVGILRSM
jgi:hypothetical protein